MTNTILRIDEREACSPGPFLELFARGTRPGWTYWGDQADDNYQPTWDTYAHNSQTDKANGVKKRPAKRKPELLELALE